MEGYAVPAGVTAKKADPEPKKAVAGKSCKAVPICERLTMIDGTCVEMLRSKTIRKNNTSGVTGVEWVQSAQRWRATICFKGKRRYLGKFEKLEDAVKARKEAEVNLHDLFVEEFDKGKHERR